MSKTLREVFGHWKAHDVASHNERVAKRLRTGAADNPGQDNAPPEVSSRPLLECDLHDQVETYCRSQGWYYLHSRMDRRTTVTVGAPDFVIFMPQGKTLCLELKRKGGKATKKQLETIAHLRKLGHVAAIADNWEDALLLLR